MTTTSEPVDQSAADVTVQGFWPGRRAAAGAAIVATVARVVSIFLWPPDSDASHVKMLATAAAHQGAWTSATAAEVVAWLTAGCAVLASVGLVRGRGRWATRIGGWAAGLSLITLGFVGGAMNSVTSVLAQQPDRAAMLGVQDHLDTPVLNAFVAVILLGDLMIVLLGVGLARARLVGWWFVALTVLAVVGYITTSSSSNHLVVFAGFLPLGGVWLVLARLLHQACSAETPTVAVRTAD